jgi:hypothetical protein
MQFIKFILRSQFSINLCLSVLVKQMCGCRSAPVVWWWWSLQFFVILPTPGLYS